jgi:hypothetical protein
MYRAETFVRSRMEPLRVGPPSLVDHSRWDCQWAGRTNLCALHGGRTSHPTTMQVARKVWQHVASDRLTDERVPSRDGLRRRAAGSRRGAVGDAGHAGPGAADDRGAVRGIAGNLACCASKIPYHSPVREVAVREEAYQVDVERVGPKSASPKYALRDLAG